MFTVFSDLCKTLKFAKLEVLGKHLFKVNNKKHQNNVHGVVLVFFFFVNFELVLHPVLIFILLTYLYYLNKCWFGYVLMYRATLNVAAEAIIRRSLRKFG